MTPVTDPSILAQLNGQPAGPKPVTDPAILAQLNGEAPKGFLANAADFAKSIPGGVVKGLSGALSAGGQAAQIEMGQPVDVPAGPETSQILQKNVTGELPKPQGRAGRFGEAVGEGLGSPTTYLGPGSMALKLGGSVLSSLGSEGAAQATEGTKYEGPARIAGALAGGVAATKALGPSVAKAAVPTAAELKAAASTGYTAARESGLELNPAALGEKAAAWEQELTNGPRYAFTGGPQGTAPKTLAVLDALQSAPADARITASNLDTLRTHLGNIAGEVQPAAGGFAKPTTDAVAAQALARRLKGYMESVPEDHVLAGSPEDYVRSIKQANGNYAAASRLGNVDARLTKAENAVDRQVAGSLDSQIKSKVGGMLDNPERLRGLNQQEKDQLSLINKGTLTSNVLRQIGRGGAGVIPLMTQAAVAGPLAMATGGTSLLPQAALAAGLYGARKAAEGMTRSRAADLAQMLAKRSPLYESRVRALPAPDTMSNKAAMARALLQIR